MEGELELNTLERFSKRSPDLVLEEHGSCEVPAGCGGVVMRWLNVSQELPVLFRLYTPGKVQVYLDGKPLESPAVRLAYGTHTLGLALEDLPDGEGAFIMSARRNLAAPNLPKQNLWVSAADGHWWGTASPPQSENWHQPSYQPQGWSPLQETSLAETPDNRWVLRSLIESQACALGLAGGGSRLWARRQFELNR